MRKMHSKFKFGFPDPEHELLLESCYQSFSDKGNKYKYTKSQKMALTKKQNSITFFSYKATIFKKSLKLDLNFFPSDLEVQKLKLSE